MIKKMCIISSYYPSKKDPYYTFVGALVEQYADMGIECHVITPVSQVEKLHKGRTRIETTKKGNKIYVYCPKYIVFPSRVINGFYTYKLTVFSLWNAIGRVFKEKIKTCDVIYSHFIESGLNAAWLKEKTGIPAFMAVGESRLSDKELTYSLFKDILYEGLDGIICVSSSLKKELIEKDVISHNKKILVAPNGIDLNLYYPRDKQQCRSKFGITEDDYVICFVGGFIERKGFDKVQQCIKRHPEWKCILIGNGVIPITIEKKQIIFCGRQKHESIPFFLSASDVFVLPTKAEGCCNAILEAMGCGLPIISSDLSFNQDIITEKNALLIDPNNTDEIEIALETVHKDKLFRKRLAAESLNAAYSFSLSDRALKILAFMEEQL